jgi:hypothetical protein
MSDKSQIYCSTCGCILGPDNIADSGRHKCKPCRNAYQRARYIKRGPPGRRGWIAPTRDGDRKQARRRVNYLVEQGLIPKPSDLGCMDCGDGVFPGNPRHEYDHARGYDGANQLYVEPVCSICHHNREAARRG